MKMRLTILMMGLAAILGAGVPAARAAVSFSAGIEINSAADFYSPLAPHGTWVEVGTYGRCWRPVQVAVDWTPYSEGYWEWTDYGWYWVSDEPWSWACYHYGSWVYDSSYGWVWIPGTEWAPAWVVWRTGPDYIGWVPCAPRGVILAPQFFVFVDIHRFHGQRLHRSDLIVNNTTIINRTKVINNVRSETRTVDGTSRKVFVNPGPGVEPVQRATGEKFAPKPIQEVIRQTSVPETVKRSQAPATQPGATVEQPRKSTGREEQRIYNEAPQPGRAPEKVTPPASKPAPVAPVVKRDAVPPTGREQPRIYHESPKPAPEIPAPEPPRTVPERRMPPPVAPPERPLPPTGRELPPGHRIAPPPPPVQPVPPPAPQAPLPAQRGWEKDKEKPHGEP